MAEEAVVVTVAFTLAVGWFSTTLAKLLCPGLGYRCAGLESQPVLPFLVLEGGGAASSAGGPLGTTRDILLTLGIFLGCGSRQLGQTHGRMSPGPLTPLSLHTPSPDRAKVVGGS